MYALERSLVQDYDSSEFAIVGVNSDSTPEKLRKVMADNDLTWPSFFDGSTRGPIATDWRVTGWPTVFVIDAEGVIRFRGSHGFEDLIAELVVKRQGI